LPQEFLLFPDISTEQDRRGLKILVICGHKEGHPSTDRWPFETIPAIL